MTHENDALRARIERRLTQLQGEPDDAPAFIQHGDLRTLKGLLDRLERAEAVVEAAVAWIDANAVATGGHWYEDHVALPEARLCRTIVEYRAATTTTDVERAE